MGAARGTDDREKSTAAASDTVTVKMLPEGDSGKKQTHPKQDELIFGPVQPTRGCSFGCVGAWVGLLVSLLLVGAGTATLIMALTFSTQDPEFQVSKVDLVQVHLSRQGSLLFDRDRFSIDLNARVNVRAAVFNPNDHEVVVEAVEINLKLFGQDVGRAAMKPFHLRKKGSRQAVVPFNIRNVPLLGTGKRRSVVLSTFEKGQVDLQLTINSVGRVKLWGITTPAYNVKMVCNMTVDPTGDRVFKQSCEKKRAKA